MNTFRDVHRAKKWCKQIRVEVCEVGKPEMTDSGYCQAIQATDSRGATECINCFYNDLTFGVAKDETGEQWYDIKWDGQFYCGKPALARNDPISELQADVAWLKKELKKLLDKP